MLSSSRKMGILDANELLQIKSTNNAKLFPKKYAKELYVYEEENEMPIAIYELPENDILHRDLSMLPHFAEASTVIASDATATASVSTVAPAWTYMAGGLMAAGGVAMSTKSSSKGSKSSISPLESSIKSLAEEQAQSVIGYHDDGLVNTDSYIIRSLDISLAKPKYVWTNKQAITYSFDDVVPPIYKEEDVDLADTWAALTPALQDASETVMRRADEIIATTFTNVARGGGIRFSTDTVDTTSHGYYPSADELGGDMFLGRNVGNRLENGDSALETITHELGHALGLKHTHEAEGLEVLPRAEDNVSNAIMSYVEYKYKIPVFTVDIPNEDVNVESSYCYQEMFQVYDIAALQHIYGIETTTRTGNDVYAFGEEAFYYAIWDAGGIDTIDLSATTCANTIRLAEGAHSDVNYRSVEEQIVQSQVMVKDALKEDFYNGWIEEIYTDDREDIYTGENALSIAYGAIIENATGGSRNDIFYDNFVNNVLRGGGGDDTFYLGAGGFDTIVGGNGMDSLMLSLSREDVQMERFSTGETVLVATNFAIKMSEVESIHFDDQMYTFAAVL